jgi:hypothetical protein
VRGKEITPFLLQHLATATGGAALTANIALLRNNVRVATEVAVALAIRPNDRTREGVESRGAAMPDLGHGDHQRGFREDAPVTERQS